MGFPKGIRSMKSTRMGLIIFVMEALRNLHSTAAIVPSSRLLARAMTAPLPLSKARNVVELGAGTGAITQTLLNVLPENATLFSLESNPRFYHYMSNHFLDSRLKLFNESAEAVVHVLRQQSCSRIDAAVSSLGLGYMSDRQRHSILLGLSSLLHNSGAFTHFQYIHGMQFRNGQFTRFNIMGLLQHYFSSVQRTIVWRNIPPAFVFTCSL